MCRPSGRRRGCAWSSARSGECDQEPELGSRVEQIGRGDSPASDVDGVDRRQRGGAAGRDGEYLGGDSSARRGARERSADHRHERADGLDEPPVALRSGDSPRTRVARRRGAVRWRGNTRLGRATRVVRLRCACARATRLEGPWIGRRHGPRGRVRDGRESRMRAGRRSTVGSGGRPASETFRSARRSRVG